MAEQSARPSRKAVASKAVASKAAASTAATKKTVAKKGAAKQGAPKSGAVKKTAAKKTPATKTAATKTVARPRAPKVDPETHGPAKLRVVRDSDTAGELLGGPDETPYGDSPLAGRTADIEGAVSMLVGVLRAAGSAAGLSGDDLERKVAGALSYIRRRMTGDYLIDDFGFDEEFTDQIWLPLLRPLYKKWFRVEVRGIENLPMSGRALIVANHSGTLPMDGLMTQVAVHDEHPAHRHVRMLGADLVFKSPFIGEISRKSGTTLASNADAERLLEAGELVAVWPEGFKGIGKPFSDRYRLQRFGRGGFVSAALKTGSPIIPCSIVGAEEIFPLIGNAKSIARVFGFPYFPITPFFPWFGILGAIPLPSKWIIEFGPAVPTDQMDPGTADDPMVVFDLTDQIRESIQQTLYSLLLQRRSVFF